MSIDPEQQERLRKLAEQQKMPTATIKSKESSGLNAFLKKKDPELEKLKQKYMGDAEAATSKSAYKPSDTQFTHYSDVENYIEK